MGFENETFSGKSHILLHLGFSPKGVGINVYIGSVRPPMENIQSQSSRERENATRATTGFTSSSGAMYPAKSHTRSLAFRFSSITGVFSIAKFHLIAMITLKRHANNSKLTGNHGSGK